MIKVTIIMDEEKIKAKSDLSVEETYKRIDNIAKEVGITKKEGFDYIGEEHENDNYVKFMFFLDKLEENPWFYNFVSTWTYEDCVDYQDWRESLIEEGLIKAN